MEFHALLLGLTLSFAVIMCEAADPSDNPDKTATKMPRSGSTVTPAEEGSNSTTTKEPTSNTTQTTTNTTSETTTPKPSSTTSRTRANATLSPQEILKLFKANIGFYKTHNLSAKLTDVLKELGYTSIKTTPKTTLKDQATKPDSPTPSDKSPPSTLSTSTPAQHSSAPTGKTTKKIPLISKEGKSRRSTQWLGYNRLWRHTTRSPEKNRPWWLTTRWQGYYNTWRLTTRWQGYYNTWWLTTRWQSYYNTWWLITRWQGYYKTRWNTKPWQGYYGPIQRDSQTASGHFAVVFLVAVPLVFGICFLCRKRQRTPSIWK